MAESPIFSQSESVMGQAPSTDIPEATVSNALFEARQNLVSVIKARPAEEVLFFPNPTRVYSALSYDGQPFDFETGTFKPEAVLAFRDHMDGKIAWDNFESSLNLQNEIIEAEQRIERFGRSIAADQKLRHMSIIYSSQYIQ